MKATKLQKHVSNTVRRIGAIDRAQQIFDGINLNIAKQAAGLTSLDLRAALENAMDPTMALHEGDTAVSLVEELGLMAIFECRGSVAHAYVESLDYVKEEWSQPLGGSELIFDRYELVPKVNAPFSIYLDESDEEFRIQAFGDNDCLITGSARSHLLAEYLNNYAEHLLAEYLNINAEGN